MEEGSVEGEHVVVMDQYPAELAEPGVGAFDFPASFVASQFPPILVSFFLVVLSVGRDQLDASLNHVGQIIRYDQA